MSEDHALSTPLRKSGRPAPHRRVPRRLAGLGGLVVLLGILSLLSVAVGTRSVPLNEIAQAILAYDADNPEHIVLLDIRLPRLIAAVLVGAALAMAGALMQAVTRNPLADPGILGVNAGAAFAVVFCIWILGVSDTGFLVWPAMLGAAGASVCVYLLGAIGQGGPTPVRLLLAGAALSALLFALVRGVLLVSHETLDVYRFWVVGSLHGLRIDDVTPLLPFFGVGFVAAVLGSSMLNALALGDDVARSLGLRVGLVRAWNTAAVACLCGTAVALAGPIAFLGLVVPHMARALTGSNMKILPLYCALIGAILLLAADICGRVILKHSELQAGVMVALLGGPGFLWLFRRTRIMRL